MRNGVKVICAIGLASACLCGGAQERYREYTYHVEGRRTVTLGNYLMVVPPPFPMTETERLERVEKYRSVCDSLLKENEYRRLGEWNFKERWAYLEAKAKKVILQLLPDYYSDNMNIREMSVTEMRVYERERAIKVYSALFWFDPRIEDRAYEKDARRHGMVEVKVCDEDAQAYSFEIPYYIGIRLYPPEWEDGLAKTWIPFPYIIPNRNYKGNIVMRHEVIPKIIEERWER